MMVMFDSVVIITFIAVLRAFGWTVVKQQYTSIQKQY